MALSRSIGRLLSRIMCQHDDFVSPLKAFDRKLHARKQGDFLSATVELLGELRGPLLAHFRQEDVLFFPAVLLVSEDYRMVRLILKLHAEHCWFRHEVVRLDQAFGQMLRDRTLPPKRAQNEMNLFVTRLGLHAEVENERVFTLWEKNPNYHLALNRVRSQARQGD